eukprot:XP_003724884.1 PREDICTED: uncharacterized protein LOC100889255 [Strongylocentrotus purpuratus]
MDAIRNEILSYKPGKAVPCDDERVVFPPKLVIGMVNDYIGEREVPVFINAMIDALYVKEGADEPAEKRPGLWITDSISIIVTIPRRTCTATSKAENLAEKVACMVKIVDTLDIQVTVEESKKIMEITGRFPVCAILKNDDPMFMDKAIETLKGSGMTDHYVVPWPSKTRTDVDKLEWLRLLHKCLPEADRMLAAKDLKKTSTDPRCESLLEKTKKDLEEANLEKRSLQQKIKELEQEFQEFLASPEGNDKGSGELEAENPASTRK